MLVLGAVGLLCLSRGELQAIKENRKQNRLAQKRRKNLLKADIVFCSCFDLVVKKLSRADLQLLITAKEKEAAEAGEAQPTGASCGCSRTLGVLGQQSKVALDVCWSCSLSFPPQCNIIIVPSSFVRKQT